MKKIYALLAAVCMLFVFSACTENSEELQNRNQELVGCWVTKSSDGLIGGIQFFSDGTFVEKYQEKTKDYEYSDGYGAEIEVVKWSGYSTYENNMYCAEFDGTLKRGGWIYDYKLENNKLIISEGEEAQEFIKWDKNISHIEEYTENERGASYD